MPTYEYACKLCGHQFEQFQSMKDAPLRRCPACKKLGLQRLISGGAGLIFKGTGFYETDYKRAAPTKAESAADSPKVVSTPAATAERKPAETKTPAKAEPAKTKPSTAKA